MKKARICIIITLIVALSALFFYLDTKPQELPVISASYVCKHLYNEDVYYTDNNSIYHVERCIKCGHTKEVNISNKITFIYNTQFEISKDITIIVNKATLNSYGSILLDITSINSSKKNRVIEALRFRLNDNVITEKQDNILLHYKDKPTLSTYYLGSSSLGDFEIKDLIEARSTIVEIDFVLYNSKYEVLKKSTLRFDLSDYIEKQW